MANMDNYSKELANLTSYVYAKAADIANRYGVSPTTAIRASGLSMATATMFGAMKEDDSKSVIEQWENGGCKDPINLNLTSSDKSKDDAENEAKAKADAERQARIENNRKKIEKIKNAQVLGIKFKDGVHYSLVKYFSTPSVENGIVKVYDIADESYRNIGIDSIEIIA